MPKFIIQVFMKQTSTDIENIKTEDCENVTDENSAKKEIKKQKKYQKHHLPLYGSGKDLSYRGPFGIIHMRAFGWFFLVVSQLVNVISISSYITGQSTPEYLPIILTILGGLALPCFIIASYGYILQNKDNQIKIIITYAVLSAVIIAGFYAAYFHYGITLFKKIYDNPADAFFGFDELLTIILGSHSDFNVFIDLFLCSIFVYFLTYDPKKYFQGKKIVIFRLFIVIPILYEIGAIVIKILDAFGVITLPAAIFPFLPTKTPLLFIAFIFIAFAEYFKKKKFFKLGGTQEQFNVFFKTKKNSFMFAKFTALTFAILGSFEIISLLILFGISDEPIVINILTVLSKLKAGSGLDLIILSPFVLFFSYNRMHKPSRWDIIITILGIGCMALCYIEGLFSAIMTLL